MAGEKGGEKKKEKKKDGGGDIYCSEGSQAPPARPLNVGWRSSRTNGSEECNMTGKWPVNVPAEGGEQTLRENFVLEGGNMTKL
jgi:hypothetical protein